MNPYDIKAPAFVLEEALLRKNLELLQKVEKEAGITIILALKGFALWPAFGLVKKYLSGATASSLHEARLCYEEMGSKAHAYAPAYAPYEFEEFSGYCSHMIFNSMNQFELFGKRAIAKGISCGLRVNPGYSPVETDLYNPSAPSSRLGMRPEELPKTLPAGVDGLHFHVLCESGSEHLEIALAAFEKLYSEQLKQVKWVNMGGGHLITRKGYDVERLIRILKAFKARHQVEVVLEPGSAAAWETGFLIANVLDIVEREGIKTAILDISCSAHMPDTMEMPYRPNIRHANKDVSPTDKHRYRIGGGTCLAGDFLEEYAFEKALQIGDKIILEDMMHYTMVKTTTFNGVRHPDIGMLGENGTYTLFKEFSYENFKNRLG